VRNAGLSGHVSFVRACPFIILVFRDGKLVEIYCDVAMATLTWGLPRQRRVDTRRSLIRVVLCILVAGLLYLFYIFAIPQLLRFRFRDDLSWYDLGAYGFGPSRSYVSFQYQSPAVEITVVDDDRACDDSGYTFLSPRGDSVAHPGPMILDANGELVWMKHNRETTHDFKVQRFLGQDFLTYWQGEQVEGRGYGSWYMVSSLTLGNDSYLTMWWLVRLTRHTQFGT
jgi:hypothetical protein